MPHSIFLLGIVTLATLAGDYFLKEATRTREGVFSFWFISGAATYGLLAFGWYFLMKSNSLASIGVMFSASTILLLAGLGYFVFKEQFGIREALGVSLAILAVVIMNPK